MKLLKFTDDERLSLFEGAFRYKVMQMTDEELKTAQHIIENEMQSRDESEEDFKWGERQ